MSEMRRKRWIDALKGLLLILVCLSHFGSWPWGLRYLIVPTGVIWVPAFIFLSGMLYNPSNDYVKKKARALLLPYFVLSLIMLVVDWNLYSKGCSYGGNALLGILNGYSAPKSAPLWFLPVLFLVSVMFSLLERVFGKIEKVVVSSLLMSGVGYLCYINDIHLPMKLDVALSAMLIYCAGFLLKHIEHHLSSVWPVFIICFALLLVSFVSCQWNMGGVLGKNEIRNYFYFHIGSTAGVISVVLGFITVYKFAFAFHWFRIASAYFEWISKNGILLLASHFYILIIFDNLQAKFIPNIASQFVFFLKAMILIIMIPIIKMAFADSFPVIFGKQSLPRKTS